MTAPGTTTPGTSVRALLLSGVLLRLQVQFSLAFI